MRLFLAIELPDDVRRHLVSVQKALHSPAGRVSWTRPENLHLTLKFLGEVPDPDVPAICDAMKSLPDRATIELVASGMECFPPRGAIRIIGCALQAGDSLQKLVVAIEDACFDLGFQREGRKYRPHITLARAKEPLHPLARQNLHDATARLFPGPSFVAEQFTLVQSKLKSEGAEYAAAAHFPL